MTVYVVGNVTEDLVFTLPRLPQEGETLIATSRLSEMGGKGLNQALILARAGCDVKLVAAIGEDGAGATARMLAKTEISNADLIVVDAPTDQSIIYVAASGENHIVSTASAADALTPDKITSALVGLAAGDTVLVQGNLGLEATCTALQMARTAGAGTVANPSPIRWNWESLYPLIDLAIVNTQELASLGNHSSIEPAVAALRAAGLTDVLVTLGADGAQLFTVADAPLTVPAARTRIVDTAGAGDTFCGVYLGAGLSGLPPDRALKAAAHAAALTVSRPGTLSAFPTRGEIETCLRDAGEP
ncbi:PfkB family carbohydrate kinase [Oceaniglobus indicus]|uniref:PfkB family carbohydrate kinase n=1 Tax=Oceaniglobus indicus TaxID=2047749 RepID=UPI000C1940BA|nr:PfkB family carbohydrate kinase [Oceaniglobus indicus]